jgi:hypothetical protein
MIQEFACCFCGQTIEPKSPDVGSLLYTTDWDKAREVQYDQGLYCHATCLQARLDPSVKLYVLTLASDSRDLTEEEAASLPQWLREAKD